MTAIENVEEKSILNAKDKARLIARIAEDKHAKNVVILNIRKLSSFADYLVICSVESDRQLRAVADDIENEMRLIKDRPLGSEGLQSGRWALIDCNDVVVHVFTEVTREHYDMDGMWAEAERVDAHEVVKSAPVVKAVVKKKPAPVAKVAVKKKPVPVVKAVAKKPAPVVKAATKGKPVSKVKAIAKKKLAAVVKAVAKNEKKLAVVVKAAVKKSKKKLAAVKKAVAKKKPVSKVKTAIKKKLTAVKKAVAKKKPMAAVKAAAKKKLAAVVKAVSKKK